jgi:hypothetical protein
MTSLLVHGCYDAFTLKTLSSMGVQDFGFDLRPQRPNFLTLEELRGLLRTLLCEEVVLTFGHEKQKTILAMLDLLKDLPMDFLPEFRDERPAAEYEAIGVPFLWLFHPGAKWQEILRVPNLEAVLLPLRWQEWYHSEPGFWALVEKYEVRVLLHAETFDEANFFVGKQELAMSLDLATGWEKGFRQMDPEKLRKLKNLEPFL